jgi:FAD synthase
MRALSAEEFLQSLRSMVPFSHIVVGPDVAFGKSREGNKAFLEKHKDFETIVVDKLSIDGKPVSSSRIRKALCLQDFQEAEKLLGRPYVIEARRTSETEWDPQGFQLPPKGAYKAFIRYNDQNFWHEIDVHVSSIIEIEERNETSHSAEIQLRNI